MSLPRKVDLKRKSDSIDGTPGIYRKLTDAEVMEDFLKEKEADHMFFTHRIQKSPKKESKDDSSLKQIPSADTKVPLKTSSSVGSAEKKPAIPRRRTETKPVIPKRSPATQSSIPQPKVRNKPDVPKRSSSNSNSTQALRFQTEKSKTAVLKEVTKRKEINKTVGNNLSSSSFSSTSSSSSSSSGLKKTKQNKKSLNVDKSFVPISNYYQYAEVDNKLPPKVIEEKAQIRRKDKPASSRINEKKPPKPTKPSKEVIPDKAHENKVAYYGPVILLGSEENLTETQTGSSDQLNVEEETIPVNVAPVLTSFKPNDRPEVEKSPVKNTNGIELVQYMDQDGTLADNSMEWNVPTERSSTPIQDKHNNSDTSSMEVTPPPLPCTAPPPHLAELPSDFNIEHTVKKLPLNTKLESQQLELEDEVFEVKTASTLQCQDNRYLENSSFEITTSRQSELETEIESRHVQILSGADVGLLTDCRILDGSFKKMHHASTSSSSSSDDDEKRMESEEHNTVSKEIELDTTNSSADGNKPSTEDKPLPPPRKQKAKTSPNFVVQPTGELVDVSVKLPIKDTNGHNTSSTSSSENDTKPKSPISQTELLINLPSNREDDLIKETSDIFVDCSECTSDSPSVFSTPRGHSNKIRSVSSYSSSSEDEGKKPYKISGHISKSSKTSDLLLSNMSPGTRQAPLTAEVPLENVNSETSGKSLFRTDPATSENITTYVVNIENEREKTKSSNNILVDHQRLDVEKNEPELKFDHQTVETNLPEHKLNIPPISNETRVSKEYEFSKPTDSELESSAKGKKKSTTNTSNSSSSDSDNTESKQNKSKKKSKSKRKSKRTNSSGGITAKIGEFFKRKEKKPKTNKEKKKSTTDEEDKECDAKSPQKSGETKQERSPIYDDLMVEKASSRCNAGVNLSGPSIGSTSIKLPSIKVEIPSVNSPNVEIPTTNIKVETSTADSPNVDVEAPNLRFDVPSVKASNLDVEAISAIAPDLKVETPSINSPNSKEKNPSANVEVEANSPRIDLPGVKAKPNLESPSVEFEKDSVQRNENAVLNKEKLNESINSSITCSSSKNHSSSDHKKTASQNNSIVIEEHLDRQQSLENSSASISSVTNGLQWTVASPLAISPSLATRTPVRNDKTQTQSGTPHQLYCNDNHFVVVAIDFGTTYSGYAFSFVRDPDTILMMRKWEGGDPGVINQKTPTIILLEPSGKFHSFGFAARDAYNDLDPKEASSWLYFDKFKMVLHHKTELTKDTMLEATNGNVFPAINIFAYALKFMKDHVLQELTDQSGFQIINEDIRWVITVPAIWKAPAKQFMRQAAYSAGLVSSDSPDKLLIALEPEAASIYCRKLKMHQLIPEYPIQRPLKSPKFSRPDEIDNNPVCDDIHSDVNPPEYSFPLQLSPNQTLDASMRASEFGTRYMVVDCGGGTVDITVHELSLAGKLIELHKATGGPHGAIGVDKEFEKLLGCIFGKEFIVHYKEKYPVGWLNLMTNFESRKRSANPAKPTSSNVSLPFSFIDYHKKFKGKQVEVMVKKHGDNDIRWSAQGMLRLSPEAMRLLFAPTVDKIKQAIGDIINNPHCRRLKYMFLVGGFAESPLLQHELRKEFDSDKIHIVKILIPQASSLAILKGAVMFGLDPTVVNIRRSRLTYGIGVLNRFDPDKHSESKLVTRDGKDWCTDVFEKFVNSNEAVALGDTVVKSYTPAVAGQTKSVINIYCSENDNVQFITDPGVMKCGTLTLDLGQNETQESPYRREIQIRMCFGDTEIKVSAQDIATGQVVRSAIDFLNK